MMMCTCLDICIHCSTPCSKGKTILQTYRAVTFFTVFGWWFQLQRYSIFFSHYSSSILQLPAR